MRAQAVMGARENALGQAVSALPGSRWSVFGNPAMLDEEVRSAAFFGIRNYGFAELTDKAAAVTFPVPIGVLGAGVHRYGYDLFSETRVRLSYKSSYGGFHYGLTLNYSHVSQGGGYGSAGALGIDAGIAASLSGRLWIGARATNVNLPEYRDSGERLPGELGIGFSYRLSEVALFLAETVKDVRFPLSFRGGVEVTVLGNCTGRIGITTGPVTYSAGLGVGSARWRINLAVRNHADLGISPGLDLTLNW